MAMTSIPLPMTYEKRKNLVEAVLTPLRSIGRGIPSDFWFNEDATKLYFVGYEEYSNSSQFYYIDVPSKLQDGGLFVIWKNFFA